VGASINAIGNLNSFNANNGVGGAQAQSRARFSPFERQTPDSTSQSNGSSESGSGTDAGELYQVPAGVVLQNQLQGVTEANSPAQVNVGTGVTAATTQAASSRTAAGKATQSSANGAAATTQAPSSTTAAGNATQSSTNDAAATTQAASSTTATGNATQSSTNDAAAATTTASSSTSPSVQSEEDQLYATLQSLGLSPAAIQQFMNTAELLAETSPGLFQAFENAVTTIVESGQAPISSAGLVSTAGAASAPATSNTSSTSDAEVAFAAVEVSASGSAVTPASSGQTGSTSSSTPAANSQAEFATVQVSEAEVQITPASSGQGSEISAAAVSFTATIELPQATPQTTPANTSSQAAAASSTTGANTNNNTSSATA
jgi:hypothetical protein